MSETHVQPVTLDAVDPQVCSTVKPSTRDKSSEVSAPVSAPPQRTEELEPECPTHPGMRQADCGCRLAPQRTEEIGHRAAAYMASDMAMPDPVADQEQNWILGHLVTFATRELAHLRQEIATLRQERDELKARQS